MKSIEKYLTAYLQAREKKEHYKRLLEEWTEKAGKREQALIDLMAEAGIKSFHSPQHGLITSTEKIWGRIIDPIRAQEAFKELGLFHEMFQLTPVKRRLNEFIRTALENGEGLPDGVDFSVTKYISVRKA